MTTFWILITGIFYLFIAIMFRLKKKFKIIYILFGLGIIILSILGNFKDLKPLIILLLYLPLIILALKKERIFK